MKYMKTISRTVMSFVAAVITLALVGCTATVTNTNTNTNTTSNANRTSNANTATTTPVSSNTANASNVTVTLPLLDAMFAEESFANDLKSRLQLTDEQVGKLKNIAREATSKLREGDDKSPHQGTTAAARAQAEDQIKATIGPEKSQQLIAYIGERYNGAAPPAPATAGTVPSDTRILVNAPAFRMDVF